MYCRLSKLDFRFTGYNISILELVMANCMYTLVPKVMATHVNGKSGPGFKRLWTLNLRISRFTPISIIPCFILHLSLLKAMIQSNCDSIQMTRLEVSFLMGSWYWWQLSYFSFEQYQIRLDTNQWLVFVIKTYRILAVLDFTTALKTLQHPWSQVVHFNESARPSPPLCR